MVRWQILKTLLWKEALRFRYNLGLLVVIGALLALSALVAIGSRMGTLFGQATVRKYYVAYNPASLEAKALAEFFRANLPPPGNSYKLDPDKIEIVSITQLGANSQERQARTADCVVAGLDFAFLNTNSLSLRDINYYYPPGTESLVYPFHHWCQDVLHKRTGGQIPYKFHPNLVQDVKTIGTKVAGGSVLSKVVTALVTFAFYLLSFNIYITTTAEEREKRALLAIMLTPARPLEVILAKVIFYATLSVVVAMGVVAMYRIDLLADPLLWLTIFTGAAAYVAIGTVVLCVVRWQTTINNVSMMYLIFTAIIMLLGQEIWGLHFLRELLVENYLYRHLEQIIDGKRYTRPDYEQLMITIFTVVWIVIAVMVFRRRGVRIAHATR